ncbi:MAG: hypothetical protein N2036_05110 [Bryobacteraceae bacterium]|nr:hypothetical protein [Bryobacteraceae bacterium]
MATAEAEPVIAVAAEPLEFRGLLRRARGVRNLRWPVLFAREAAIGARHWILAAHGPGPKLARHAAQTALDRCGGRATLVSTGFCGAVLAGASPGDIFAASEVVDAGSGDRYPALTPACGRRFLAGTLWSQDRVAATPEEKAQIAARGAVAVDMEAAAVAAEAAARRVPFYCIRAVSDGADEPLPLDFNRFRASDGRFSRWRITLAVLVHPSRLKPLLRFHGDCRRAADQLGEFLVHCRF